MDVIPIILYLNVYFTSMLCISETRCEEISLLNGTDSRKTFVNNFAQDPPRILVKIETRNWTLRFKSSPLLKSNDFAEKLANVSFAILHVADIETEKIQGNDSDPLQSLFEERTNSRIIDFKQCITIHSKPCAQTLSDCLDTEVYAQNCHEEYKACFKNIHDICYGNNKCSKCNYVGTCYKASEECQDTYRDICQEHYNFCLREGDHPKHKVDCYKSHIKCTTNYPRDCIDRHNLCLSGKGHMQDAANKLGYETLPPLNYVSAMQLPPHYTYNKGSVYENYAGDEGNTRNYVEPPEYSQPKMKFGKDMTPLARNTDDGEEGAENEAELIRLRQHPIPKSKSNPFVRFFKWLKRSGKSKT